MQLKVLSFVLAGGKGTRLYPLTKERAKPAVPFGGQYRIIDFVLSNLVNSGIHSVYVLIQFKSQSLLQHLRDGWEFSGLLKDHYIIPVPAQMRTPDETWYRGTADAMFQNVNLIEQSDPHVVAVFGADHIYRMNIREMIEYHEQKRAQVTVAAIPVAKEFASEFGVIEIAPDGRILSIPREEPQCADDARQSGHGVGVDGQLHLLHRTAVEVSVRRQQGRFIDARLWPRHPAQVGEAGRRVLLRLHRRTGFLATPWDRRSTGATSAPLTPTTRRIWISER